MRPQPNVTKYKTTALWCLSSKYIEAGKRLRLNTKGLHVRADIKAKQL